jgi:toxin YoeB
MGYSSPDRINAIIARRFAEIDQIGVHPSSATRVSAALWLLEQSTKFNSVGIGKPESLRYLAPDTWSRRLSQEHRIMYLVNRDRADFLQARYHY